MTFFPVARFAAAIGLLVTALACLPARALATEPPPSATASERIVAWAARAGRVRPVVAVVAENAGTELVDFMIPYGVIADSGVADVVALSTAPGPIRLRPALRVQAQQTIADFDAATPLGADYVIVPAVTEENVRDPALLAWLRAQSAKGATVVSICDGALVVANAGLFDGRRATGHWATRSRREEEHPAARWLGNTRYVADGNVVSSAGVSAAIPTALALVEAMGGTEAATRTAARLGAIGWSNTHDSAQFRIGVDAITTYIGNRWLKPDDRLEIPVGDGVDDIALALTLDAYGRTMRSPVVIATADGALPRSSHGLVLLPPLIPSGPAARTLALPEGPSLAALDRVLADIGRRYGSGTERYVALEMEYAPGYAAH
jgi:putative intracellular protease/amidase